MCCSVVHFPGYCVELHFYARLMQGKQRNARMESTSTLVSLVCLSLGTRGPRGFPHSALRAEYPRETSALHSNVHCFSPSQSLNPLNKSDQQPAPPLRYSKSMLYLRYLRSQTRIQILVTMSALCGDYLRYGTARNLPDLPILLNVSVSDFFTSVTKVKPDGAYHL